MRNTKSKCGKVKGTQYAWSPTLEKAGETVCYWKQRKSQARDGVGGQDTDWRKNKFLMQDTLSLDQKYIIGQLKKAWANLKTVQRQA